MFEEFSHFFGSDVNQSLDLINKKLDILGRFCESYDRNDPFNAISIALNNKNTNDETLAVSKALFNIFSFMLNCNDYQEYITVRRRLSTILSSFYPNISKQVLMIRNLSDKNVTVSLGEKEGKRISITPGLKLYHVSKYSGLNELKPMFKSVRDKILYPSQRIYFCRNYPINPSGTPWNKKGYVYEYTPTSTQNLYRDEEYGADHGPCFLETNSSVTVKDVTAEMIRNYDSIRSKYSR